MGNAWVDIPKFGPVAPRNWLDVIVVTAVAGRMGRRNGPWPSQSHPVPVLVIIKEFGVQVEDRCIVFAKGTAYPIVRNCFECQGPNGPCCTAGVCCLWKQRKTSPLGSLILEHLIHSNTIELRDS